MSRASVWALLAGANAMAIAACGGGGEGTTPPIDGPAAIDAPYDPTVVETRSVQIGPIVAAPGAEDTVCIVLDLGNDLPRMVRTVRSSLTAGTHHVIATKSTSPPAPTPTPCSAFAGGGIDNAILTIAQQSAASLTYPAGAGAPITAHQSIHLEMHYANASDETLEIAGTVELDLAPEGGGLRPIDFLFTGNASLFIGAGAMTTVTSFHPLEAGSELFATTAHTHRLGTRATIELAESQSAPALRVLHDSTDWAERPLDTFEPFVIGAGQGLRLTCNYHNTTNQDVGFGTRAEDEMCFLWAHLIAP